MNPISVWKTRPWVLALLVLVGVGFVLYYQPLFRSYIFAGPDTMAPAAIGAGLRALEETSGELPLWQPWIFSGMPTLHAFTNISRLYLPNIIVDIQRSFGLPVFWSYFQHMIFSGLGCFLLLRRIGVSSAASLLGGSGFMLMPYANTMLVHGHGSQMMTLAYLPWVIWGLFRLYEKTTLTSAALLALLVGFQLQRGHAQIAYYTLLLVGFFFLIMAVRSWRDPGRDSRQSWRFTLLFVAALIVGFGLATSLFIPVMNYTPFSIRGGQVGGGTGLEYATQWSFSFGETMTFLLPSFYGFGGTTYWGGMPFTDYPNYMGILLFVLAIGAVALKRSWLTWTLAAAGVLAYLLSLGHNFFLYKIFYNYFPYFNKFRVPSMVLVLTQFSVAVLAGLGLDALLDRLTALKAERARRDLVRAAVVVGVLFLLFLAAASWLGFPPTRGVPPQLAPQIDSLRRAMIRIDAVWFLAIAGGAIGALYAWRQGRVSRIWLVGGLVALSIVDLGRIDRLIIQPPKESLRNTVMQPAAYVRRYLNRDQVADFLGKDPGPFRILPLGRLQNDNRWAALELESLSGYHPAKLANYNRFMQATGILSDRIPPSGVLRMLNVKYLVGLSRLNDTRFKEPFVAQIYTGGRYLPAGVFEFTAFLDRAWFPARVEAKGTSGDILDRVMAPDYNPVETVYVLGEGTGKTLQGGSGRILEGAWQPSHIYLKVTANDSALLVLSEIYYPGGWKARIGGEPTPIHEVNTILRGVMVPAGTHEVTLDFEPPDVRLGQRISRLALLLIVLGFVPEAVTKLRGRR
ncbi:MAG: YfhO family protein [Candidatus Marinimicrobia bacterium]|nr:YfhO family protein [Candidatus Neomarinimicrobiota bacterium]